MSHWSILKIRIVNPNRMMLSEAIRMVAKELGYKVEIKEHQAYFTHERGAIIINLDNATVKFDSHYIPREFVENLEKMITQHYTALSFSIALKSMGYMVQSQKISDRIIIRGIK